MEIKIGNRKIGNNHPVFIIAELSANHNQDFNIAIETIKAAKECGADAIKFQTYTPDTLTIDCDNDYFKIKEGLWKDKTLYQLYGEAYTPWEWQPKLKKLAEDLGLICFSSPFDKTAVDFLEKMDVPAYKVASFEIKDIPLLKYIASKGKPIIISTGIATQEDIKLAVKTCKESGNNQIILLKCTSAYPAPVEETNLKTIPDMVKKFNTLVGLSDHSSSPIVPISSVALGGCVIEKHFILDKKIGGPDADFSLDPREFKEMVDSIRETEKALGKITYELSEKVRKSIVFARSLFVVEDIKEGETLTEDNIRSIRPGYGLHPKFLDKVIGKKAKSDLKRGTPLKLEMIETEKSE